MILRTKDLLSYFNKFIVNEKDNNNTHNTPKNLSVFEKNVFLLSLTSKFYHQTLDLNESL